MPETFFLKNKEGKQVGYVEKKRKETNKKCHAGIESGGRFVGVVMTNKSNERWIVDASKKIFY